MSISNLRDKGLRLADGLAVSSSAIEDLPAADSAKFLAACENAGIESLWISEINGKEAFSSAFHALTATSKMTVVSAVARALERPPKSSAGAYALLWDRFPGRYLLGLGVSGAVRERGIGPLPFMTDYLKQLDVHLEGHRPGATRLPRVLGTYSAGLTRLAGREADGIVTALVTPAHTEWARSTLGPEPFLGAKQWVLFEEDADRARAVIRKKLAYYLTLPHQINKFRALGIDDSHLEAPGSDYLVDLLCAWGSIEQIAARLNDQLEAGADRVIVAHLDDPTPEIAERLGALSTHMRNRRT